MRKAGAERLGVTRPGGRASGRGSPFVCLFVVRVRACARAAPTAQRVAIHLGQAATFASRAHTHTSARRQLLSRLRVCACAADHAACVESTAIGFVCAGRFNELRHEACAFGDIEMHQSWPIEARKRALRGARARCRPIARRMMDSNWIGARRCVLAARVVAQKSLSLSSSSSQSRTSALLLLPPLLALARLMSHFGGAAAASTITANANTARTRHTARPFFV